MSPAELEDREVGTSLVPQFPEWIFALAGKNASHGFCKPGTGLVIHLVLQVAFLTSAL